MRRLCVFFLALGIASSAHATVRPVVGQLSIILAPGSSLPPITFTGSGVSLVNGSGAGAHASSFTIGSGVFSGIQFAPVTDPALSMTIGELKASVFNFPGSFAGLSGGGGGGPMALAGAAILCLYGPCAPFIPNLSIPLTINAGATGVGVGGTILQPGGFSVTVIAAPWTQGTATVSSILAPMSVFTLMGFGHGPATLTSTTNQPSGVIQLVTPIDIRTSLSFLPQIPSFAVMQLHLVPEPGTLLLLGSGVAGLAMLGRRRPRR